MEYSFKTNSQQVNVNTNIDLYKELDCVTDNPVSDIVDRYFICNYGIKV